MSDDGILKFSNAGGVTSLTRYPNFLTNYGDFGALQRIAYGNGSGVGNFEFTNIPQTFQDIIMVAYLRDSGSATISTNGWAINSDTSSTNYSQTVLQGDGSSATSFRTTNGATGQFSNVGSLATAGIYGVQEFHILNYANTSTYKTILWRSALDLNGSGKTMLSVATWRSTAGVSRFLFGSSGNWPTASTFELFGVKASNA